MGKVIEQRISEGLFKIDYPQGAVEFILTASSFIFDRGIFEWEEEAFQRKVEVFVDILERILGAERGSCNDCIFYFYYVRNSTCSKQKI